MNFILGPLLTFCLLASNVLDGVEIVPKTPDLYCNTDERGGEGSCRKRKDSAGSRWNGSISARALALG